MTSIWDSPSSFRSEKPVWHRVGWNSRFPRSEADRSSRGPAQSSGVTCNHHMPSAGIIPRCNVRDTAGERARHSIFKPTAPVRVHTHSTITAHSSRSNHRIRTHIVSALHPGPDGHARLDCNYGTFCGELDERLHALDNTLERVRGHLKDKTLTTYTVEAAERRNCLNSGLQTQMALMTAVFAKYCQPCSLASSPASGGTSAFTHYPS
jgi:hypothetical protein